MKKLFDSGAIYMLIAIIFALSAIYKTINDDPFVIFLQWFCAAGFALTGFLQLRKTRNANAQAGNDQGK